MSINYSTTLALGARLLSGDRAAMREVLRALKSTRTLSEAAARLRISKSTLERWISKSPELASRAPKRGPKVGRISGQRNNRPS